MFLNSSNKLIHPQQAGWGWGLGEHGRVVIHQDGSEVQRGELLLINYQAGCQALGGDLLVSKSRSGYCFYGTYSLVREDRF